LQWIKRFWESNYPGTPYDPVARRKGAPAEPPATMAPLRATGSGSSSALGGGAPVRGKTPVGSRRPGSATPAAEVAALHAQIRELSTHMEGLEKERDFYFAKVG
jgi:RP/EB family microtubule-associated protein